MSQRLQPRAHVMHQRDNVATAVIPIEPGAQVRIEGPAGEGKLLAAEAIPFGHKLALETITVGREVVKYGEVIGLATSPIARGAHVHVHNVASQRGGQL